MKGKVIAQWEWRTAFQNNGNETVRMKRNININKGEQSKCEWIRTFQNSANKEEKSSVSGG